MTMWSKHIDGRLVEYCDRRLTPGETARAERHLASCTRCRAAVEALRFASGLLQRLPTATAPDSLWRSLDAAFDAAPRPRVRGVSVTRRRLAAAVGLAAIVAIAGTFSWYSWRQAQARWEVSRVDVSGAFTPVAVGEAFETDASSRLRFTVGRIGTVDVAPSSRVRVLQTRRSEHRLALEHGEISAVISAPPRLFFVNTSSSTVVDLGCAYTMRVDDRGVGQLRVTAGWSSLEWGGRESLVPAGAMCLTRPNIGPGTPSFEDASPTMTAALSQFDFENGGERALDVVLGEARVRDTLTLWHLLSRVDSDLRGRIVDRIVALTPLPKGVLREKVLQLDRESLDRWRAELAWTW